jgi:hypothetical protein
MSQMANYERIMELERICDEAYQVIGSIAGEFHIMESPDVQRVLDNLSEKKLVHKDILPWPKSSLT